MRKKQHTTQATKIVDVYFGSQYAKAFKVAVPLRCELIMSTKKSIHLQYVNQKGEVVQRWFPIVAVEKKETVEVSVDLKSVRRTNFPPITRQSLSISGIRGVLKPYQQEGVELLHAFKGRAILGDEMGLGKTLQVIAYAFHFSLFPVVIVCPASLKDNWKLEFRKWTGLRRVYIAESKKPAPLSDLQNNEIVVINYDILKDWVSVIRKLKPALIVCDEAHYIKNQSSARHKAVKSLQKNVNKLILVTGTPIENAPIEIFYLVQLVHPTLFTSRVEFGLKYCNGERNENGWNFSGLSNEKELHRILYASCLIRRIKSQVAEQLPEKQFNEVILPLSNVQQYTKAQQSFIEYVKETKGVNASKSAARAAALSQMVTLRQLAAEGVLPSVFEWVDSFLQSGNDKLVIFAIHKKVISALTQKYADVCVCIDGSTPVKERQTLVDKFQTNVRTRIFIGNIRAAGVGLTLTASYSVVFLELPWHPGQLNQAIDRVHRIGQLRGVMIYFLVAKSTILQRMAGMLLQKQQMSDSALDGARYSGKSEVSVVSDLIRYYTTKEKLSI